MSPEKTTNLPQAYVAEELYHRKVNPESPEKTTNLPQETSVPRENYKPATSLCRWRALSQESKPESPEKTTNLPQETSVPRENYKPATSLRRWRALSQETRENYKSAHYVQNSQP